MASARQLLAWSHRFDVVLLDLQLPDGRGSELLPAIRELQARPAVVVVSWRYDAADAVPLVGAHRCDERTSTLTCESDVVPDDEVCDGLDNDCDGQIDESPTVDEGTSCDASNPEGCEVNAIDPTGEEECINGTLECVAKSGRDFCTQCGTFEVGDCGACDASCNADEDCTPNHVCSNEGDCNWVESCGPNFLDCWLPEQTGECLAAP